MTQTQDGLNTGISKTILSF